MRGITKNEMLLAIAMSEFHQTTHVLFIPPGTEYTNMLKILKNKGWIKQKTESFFELTKKAWSYVKRRRAEELKKKDAAIDAFVDGL